MHDSTAPLYWGSPGGEGKLASLASLGRDLIRRLRRHPPTAGNVRQPRGGLELITKQGKIPDDTRIAGGGDEEQHHGWTWGTSLFHPVHPGGMGAVSTTIGIITASQRNRQAPRKTTTSRARGITTSRVTDAFSGSRWPSHW